jgi:hypothetical protein
VFSNAVNKTVTRGTIFHEKLTVPQLVKINSLHFLNPNIHYCVHQSATAPYPETVQSSTNFNIHFNIILSFTPWSHKRFANQVLYAFFIPHTRATCLALVVLLQLTTLIASGENRKLWSSSSYSQHGPFGFNTYSALTWANKIVKCTLWCTLTFQRLSSRHVTTALMSSEVITWFNDIIRSQTQ